MMQEMYVKYLVDAKVGRPKTTAEFMSMLNNTRLIPNEASVFLRNFFDIRFKDSEKHIINFAPFFLFPRITNPWFNVRKDSIEVKIPWKEVPRTTPWPYDIFWYDGDKRKSERQKDNIAGYIRKDKK